MKYRSVYITTSHKEEAVKIGKALVEERLAACVNILDGMTSIYWWEGKVQQDTEAVLIAKTRASLMEELIDRVKALHSYSVPCVASWPIREANRAYIDWIEQETK